MKCSARVTVKRLGIRVGDDEVDALEPGIDHVVDGVAARAADTENGNPRLQFADVEFLQVDVHGLPLLSARAGSSLKLMQTSSP